MRRYLIHACLAFITFFVGVAAHHLINSSAEIVLDHCADAYEFVHIPSWCKPPLRWCEQPALIGPAVPNCGQLIVRIDEGRTLYLNRMKAGTLDRPEQLLNQLTEIIRFRYENRVYREGIEATSDVPEQERIERSVSVVAPASLSFGEVSDLLELLERAGASPIRLLLTKRDQLPLKSN